MSPFSLKLTLDDEPHREFSEARRAVHAVGGGSSSRAEERSG